MVITLITKETVNGGDYDWNSAVPAAAAATTKQRKTIQKSYLSINVRHVYPLMTTIFTT